MKKTIICLLLAISCITAWSVDNEYLPGEGTFQLCPNKSGGGFYWVNTATADVFKVNVRNHQWEFCGNPAGEGSGATQTYLPYLNTNGQGMYLLDTQSGKGWFYDGKKWTDMGKPDKSVTDTRKHF